MKIGILTVHRAPNYGALLQCYALQHYLNILGYECMVIDLLRPYHDGYIPTPGYEPFDVKKIHRSFKGEIKKFIGHYLHRYDANNRKFSNVYAKEIAHKKELFARFDKRIAYTRQYNSIGELYANPPLFDIYITGSDQLWNPTQPYCIEPYFLTFVKEGRKISYATSIGVSSIPDEIKLKYVSWLRSYDYISVREKEAQDILSGINKPVYRIIDPTFLLPATKWEEIIDTSLDLCENEYVFGFTLSYISDFHSFMKKYARRQNKKYVYIVHAFQDAPYTCNDKNVIGLIDVSPEQWLGLIHNASEIFTDSFHGTVFSLIFGKSFYSYIPSFNNRGSRIENLLQLFGLKERIIYNLKDCAFEAKTIDYRNVNGIIEKEREKASAFLNKAIK